MPSAIGPAMTALYDALVEAAPDSSTQTGKVQVVFGPPEAYEDQELFAIEGIEDPDESAAVLGNNRRDEDFTIVISIKVENPSGSARDVHARLFVLYEVLRAVVAANPTLNGTVANGSEVIGARPGSSSTRFSYVPREGGGFVGFLRGRVACHARISA